MPEILDSAQENFPHLYVNGEKYVFSDDVINAGSQLFLSFIKLKEMLSQFDSDCHEMMELQLKVVLGEFDQAWTQYEQFYVYELMVIEQDARRFITEAIAIEEQMQEIERHLESHGQDVYSNPFYNEKRGELIF